MKVENFVPSVSELFEQWRADNQRVAETPTGRAAAPDVLRRIAECERDIGRVPARTLDEIILKVRVLGFFRELRAEDVETIVTGVLADLDLLCRFGEDIELAGR